MRRSHKAESIEAYWKLPHKYMTLCGHEMTAQEYRFTKNRKWQHVNCKRCLEKK